MGKRASAKAEHLAVLPCPLQRALRERREEEEQEARAKAQEGALVAKSGAVVRLKSKAAPSSPGCTALTYRVPDPKAKSRGPGLNAPPVYNKTRGDKRKALAAAASEESRARALAAYRQDQRSANDTTCYYWKTWTDCHDEWWSFYGELVDDPLPLTPCKIEAVGAMIKEGDYRSAKNYIKAAKDNHLAAGHEWSSILARSARLFTASATRGIGPARQSEPLPFARVVELDLMSLSCQMRVDSIIARESRVGPVGLGPNTRRG